MTTKAAEAAFCFLQEGLSAPGRGPSAWAWLPGRDLEAHTSHLPAAMKDRYGLGSARGALVAALAYSEGDLPLPAWLEPWAEGPRGSLARFARANWYKELLARLGGLGRGAAAFVAAQGLAEPSPRAWRAVANSGLPERRLALAAGLGQLGRNSMLITPTKGPGVILGLLLLPFDPEAFAGQASGLASRAGADLASLHPACEACGNCVRACPTGALGSGPGQAFTRELCLQHWTTRLGSLPDPVRAAWGNRIYGCDACLEACPLFRCDPGAATDLGRLGPGLPLAWLRETRPDLIKKTLKPTALGLGWMPPEAWVRNAALCI